MNKIVSILAGVGLVLLMSAQPFVAQAATPTPVGPYGTASIQPPKSADDLIAQAKASDPSGFGRRLNLIRRSAAFMDVLKRYTSDQSLNAEFFAAISTDAQATALARNTAGKHYVISGTQDDPRAQLVDGAVSREGPGGVTPMTMPACPKAWAAFAAWLVGTTMLCAPFSGPAAWACAAAMGLMGLMPDFNRAC